MKSSPKPETMALAPVNQPELERVEGGVTHLSAAQRVALTRLGFDYRPLEALPPGALPPLDLPLGPCPVPR